jgi:hypothetical protein
MPKSVNRISVLEMAAKRGCAEVAEWQTQRIQNPPSERA